GLTCSVFFCTFRNSPIRVAPGVIFHFLSPPPPSPPTLALLPTQSCYTSRKHQYCSRVLDARHAFCSSPHLNEFSSTLESNMNFFVSRRCASMPSVALRALEQFLVLHAAVHDGPASHSLRTP
ncbi:unnamed protein product, partial [Ectocarpus sp. 4 AP-2014]